MSVKTSEQLISHSKNIPELTENNVLIFEWLIGMSCYLSINKYRPYIIHMGPNVGIPFADISFPNPMVWRAVTIATEFASSIKWPISSTDRPFSRETQQGMIYSSTW